MTEEAKRPTFVEYTTISGGQPVTRRKQLPDWKPPGNSRDRDNTPLVTKHITPLAPEGIIEGYSGTGPLKERIPAKALATKLHTVIAGTEVTAQVVPTLGEKNATVISTNSPRSFARETLTIDRTLSNAEDISQLPQFQKLQEKQRSETLSVETFPKGDESDGVTAVQVPSRHYSELLGHPLQDHVGFYAGKGLAMVMVADGVTSKWAQNQDIRGKLGKEDENPPLTIARMVTEVFAHQLAEYYQNVGSQLSPEHLLTVLTLTNQQVQTEATHLLETYAQTKRGPMNMIAGATLTAVAYAEGVGLIVVRVGDGRVKMSQKIDLAIKETGEEPRFLGTTQWVAQKTEAEEEAQIQHKSQSHLEPDVLFIPEDQLTRIYEDLAIFLGSDGSGHFLDQLEPELVAGAFKITHAKRVIQEADKLRDTFEDDMTLAVTSFRQLKRLAAQAKPQAAADPPTPGTQPLS